MKCDGWIEKEKTCKHGHKVNHPVCWGEAQYPILGKITVKNGHYFSHLITTPGCCREDINASDDGTILGGKWKG
jgi:hypothetical protein